MRKRIKIGEIEFATKKDALNHFKTILNSDEFGEILNQNDFQDVLELLGTHPREKEKIGVGIEKVKVVKLKYNSKSFELIRFDSTTEYFSYTKRINAPRIDFTKLKRRAVNLFKKI